MSRSGARVEATCTSYPETPNFFNFGTACGDSIVPRGDDTGVSFSLPQNMTYFGESYDTIYISVNGALSFDGVVSAYNP